MYTQEETKSAGSNIFNMIDTEYETAVGTGTENPSLILYN